MTNPNNLNFQRLNAELAMSLQHTMSHIKLKKKYDIGNGVLDSDLDSDKEETEFKRLSNNDKFAFFKTIVPFKNDTFLLHIDKFDKWFKYIKHMLNIYNINDGKCVTFTLLKYSFGFIFSNVTFEKSKKMNDNFERENIPNELTIMIDDTIYKQLKMIETVFDSFITWQGCKLTNIYHTQHTKFKMSVRGTRISISFSNNVSTGSCDDITIDYGKATLFIVPMWRVTNVHPRDDFASNLLKVPHISNDEKNEYDLTFCIYER